VTDASLRNSSKRPEEALFDLVGGVQSRNVTSICVCGSVLADMYSAIEVGQGLVHLLGVLYEIKEKAFPGEHVGPSISAFMCELESASNLFCQISMEFGVLYKILSSKHGFRENRLRNCDTLHEGITKFISYFP